MSRTASATAETPTIASVCRSCSSQIAVYLEDPYPNTENQARRLQQKLDDFIQSFNVYETGLFSLDALLLSEPSLFKRLLFLLRNTAENLARAVKARQMLASLPGLPADQDDGDSAATSGDSCGTFWTVRSNITSGLDPLESIDRNIRRLAIMSKYIDAAIPHFNLRTRLATRSESVAEFERFLRQLLMFKFKNLDPSGFLFKRLMASMVLRRARFLSLRAHNRKTELGQQRVPSATLPPAAHPDTKTRPTQITFLTEPSSPDTTDFSTRFWKPSTTSVSTTIALTGVSFPKPPALTDGAYYMRCPYCLRVYPHSVFVSRRAWEHHLKADMQPFICLQENCNRPLDAFTELASWLEHMASHSHDHGWYCHASIHSGEVFSFFTKEQFELHIRTEHPSLTLSIRDTPSLLSVISNNSRRPSPFIPDACPFCGPELSDDEHGFELPKLNLWTHVSQHLLDLALYSLPAEGEGDTLLSIIDSDSLSMSRSDVDLSGLSSQDIAWFEGDEARTDHQSVASKDQDRETFDPVTYSHLERSNTPRDKETKIEEGLNTSEPRFATSQSAIDWWLQGLPSLESPKEQASDGMKNVE